MIKDNVDNLNEENAKNFFWGGTPKKKLCTNLNRVWQIIRNITGTVSETVNAKT